VAGGAGPRERIVWVTGVPDPRLRGRNRLGRMLNTSSSASTVDASELLAQARTERWFHHINLNGWTTPGHCNKAAQDWMADHLPARFDGLSVLDIGAWDGFFSFLAEERGAARVLAVDKMQNPVAHDRGTAGFELAKKIRHSRVEYRVAGVTDLTDLTEQFDVVLFLGVYYHMRDPFAGLSSIRRLVKPGGSAYIEGLVVPGSRPVLRFLGPEEVEPWTFCAATASGLAAMCRMVGFSEARVVARRAGMSWLAYPLRRAFPNYWKEGAMSTKPNLPHRTMVRVFPHWSFWPRALVCARG